MSKLKSSVIKEYLRAQIANRETDIGYFLADMEDYYHDPSKVLEKAQGAAMHKERKTALQEVLYWIEEMEKR